MTDVVLSLLLAAVLCLAIMVPSILLGISIGRGQWK